ncbi:MULTISPECIES: universal stress protein [unclassified Curtobacterium]|uniref:universal stress protein n=1 Tax=unclassified Curtobacterium TaxID=257496 RepID=UPI0003455BFD|nr:universal stress protein [Curtobacterium sp. B18]
MTAYTVAIDDSVAGWKTVDWTVEAVDPAADVVRLLTVSEVYGEALTRSEHRLEAAEQRLRNAHPGLAITHDVTGGPTADRLVADAALGDVLVIGARQVHTIAATIRGRVAERVVAHATTPVVAVPEQWERSDGPIVVGVDARSAAAALAWAADAADRRGRDLALVRAWAVPTAMAPYANIYLEEDRVLWSNEADIELRAALRAVGEAHPALRVDGASVEGQPRDVVLQSSRGASLVVVGRRHRTALGGFLAGSVGERLMHHGHAPVCIVPQPRRAVRDEDRADEPAHAGAR